MGKEQGGNKPKRKKRNRNGTIQELYGKIIGTGRQQDGIGTGIGCSQGFSACYFGGFQTMLNPFKTAFSKRNNKI